jgi:asparagine synthase (glutamine-hydrolysing)
MCGFVGFCSHHPLGQRAPALQRDVQAALDTLAHRGPDADGVRSGSLSVLGHRRLSIVGLGAPGAQPVLERGRGLVFNGEIYPFRELARQLLGDREGRYVSDTQVLFAMLGEMGVAALPHLEGMFSFAYVDEAARTLMLVRDRFGIKPLFYRQTADGIAFASEVRALRVLDPGIVPDSAVLQAYLLSGNYPAGQGNSFFDAVHQVEPGHAVIVDLQSGKLTQHRYFDPLHEAQQSAPHTAASVEQVLSETAALVGVADVPMCFSLSGGVDSTLSLALMLDAVRGTGADVHAITCASRDDRNSELAAAQQSASRLGVQLHVCQEPGYGSVDAARDALTALTGALEAPVRSPGVMMQDQVYATAHQLGFKVIIDGEGADDVLGAYYGNISATLADILRERGPLEFLRNVAALADGAGMAPLRLAAKTVLAAVRRMGGDDQLSSRQQAVIALLWNNSLPTLMHWGDRLSMRHSIEARPFYLSRTFYAWSMMQRSAQVLQNGFNKYPLRQVLASRYRLDHIAWQARKLGYSSGTAAFDDLRQEMDGHRGWQDFEAAATGKGAAPAAPLFRRIGAFTFARHYGVV